MDGLSENPGLILVGGGGHGLVVAEAAGLAGRDLAGFLDDDPGAALAAGSPAAAWLGALAEAGRVLGGRAWILGLGDLALRRRVLEGLGEAPEGGGRAGWKPAPPGSGPPGSGPPRPAPPEPGLPGSVPPGPGPAVVVHPRAFVSPSAGLGAGVFVGPGAVVHSRARVGAHAIVNSGAVVEHDCRIGPNAHIAPGAVVGGAAAVGRDTLVGLGARVLPGVAVGDGCVVGAGAVVIGPVPDGAKIAGIPGRTIGGV